MELRVALLDFSNAADLMAWFTQQERREVEIALIYANSLDGWVKLTHQ
jgi:hypothetical protein